MRTIYLEHGCPNQIANLNNYQLVEHYVRNGLPLSSGVIDGKAKVTKLGGEPPARAVIAEGPRRVGRPQEGHRPEDA